MSYCWSWHEHLFQAGCEFDTLDEAVRAAVSEGCDEPYVGIIERRDVASFADGCDTVEGINNQDDMIGAEVEIEPTKEQEADLTESIRKVVGEWLSKNGFRQEIELIESVTRYKIVGGQVVELKGGE